MNYELKKGDRGQEVRRLQQRLNDHGQSLATDGIFGSGTQKGVSQYQQCIGETPTGVASPSTLTDLNMPVLSGLDISHHNGDVKWAPSTELPRFCYIKSTEGRTHTDTRFHETASRCSVLGVPFGFYHFGRPDTDVGADDALKEAEFFADKIGNMESTLRPVLDLEKGLRTDDTYNAEWAIRFCERIQKLLGVIPIIYTAKWYYDAYLVDADKGLLTQLSQYDLWLASYNNGTNTAEPDRLIPLWDEWLIWQYTSSGSFPGIQGKVDVNHVAGGKIQNLLW